MITFHCPACRRAFSVPDDYAGRRAECACGQVLIVPASAPAPKPSESSATPKPAAPVVGLRFRRLAADEQEMRRVFSDETAAIRLVEANGSPPDKYVIEFHIHGLKDDTTPIDVHRAEIHLTSDYPRVGPQCRMLTPIFHPNIDATSICIGDHWAAGERISDLVTRIGEMIAYQAYNIRSPLNAEAAMWADLNQDKLPIDARDLRASELVVKT